MSFISFTFFLLLAATFILYFLLPLRYRWIVLLLSSLAFYIYGGALKVIFLLLAVLTAFLTGRKISSVYEDASKDKNEQKKKAKPVLIIGTIIIVGMLVFFKIASKALSGLSGVIMGHTITIDVLIPLGISYFTFALVGYMADVYWRKTAAEKNILHLMLYSIYFPQSSGDCLRRWLLRTEPHL